MGSTTDAVRSAATPQQAMLAIAKALDKILEQRPDADGWFAEWSTEPTFTRFEPTSLSEQSALIKEHLVEPLRETLGQPSVLRVEDVSTDERIVEIAAPDEAKRLARLLFAQQQLRLDQVYAEPPDDGRTWSEIYAQGGPMWLYTADRDTFMSYPYQVRQSMVADVEADDPAAAGDMGRDVLKHPSETGPGAVAMQVADGLVG